ncbi:odorant receptor 43b-like isoform X2 [Diachasmimorpha longicaudata]|uniref:odorant receptor 43b-like isoform X2 n=1 Tax=Diachasmimorpha longicaudata TaxID=58733 RepID=UPI0030B8E3B0
MVDKLLLPDSHYVAFSLKCLTFCGLWNPYSDYRKWLYNTYTIVVILLMPLTRINGYIMAARSLHHNFLQQTLMLFMVSVFIVGFLKHMNLLWHRSDIKFIAAVLTWERSTVSSTGVALYRNKVVTKTMKITRSITVIWLWLVILDLPLFYRDNLQEDHRSIDDLPISFTPLRKLLEHVDFFVVLAIDYLTLVMFCWSVISNDCLFLTLMLHIETQLKILNFRLETGTTADQPIINFETSEKNTSAPHSVPNQQLIICIRHYQNIFRMMRVMKRVYASILLPQLLSSITLLTVVGIHVFVVIVILTLSSAMIQLGIYCLGGNSIIVESNLTSVAAYHCQWYIEDAGFKTNLIIFLSMVKEPLSIRAAGVFEVSFVTLKSVLAKSYSAMAVLQRAAV